MWSLSFLGTHETAMKENYPGMHSNNSVVKSNTEPLYIYTRLDVFPWQSYTYAIVYKVLRMKEIVSCLYLSLG